MKDAYHHRCNFKLNVRIKLVDISINLLYKISEKFHWAYSGLISYVCPGQSTLILDRSIILLETSLAKIVSKWCQFCFVYILFTLSIYRHMPLKEAWAERLHAMEDSFKTPLVPRVPVALERRYLQHHSRKPNTVEIWRGSAVVTIPMSPDPDNEPQWQNSWKN